MDAHISLILGGAWSGKTDRAQQIASEHHHVLWIGTSTETLPEIADHIRTLRARRPAHWQHVAAPFDLTDALRYALKSETKTFVVIDSISQWISNLIARSATRYDEQQVANIIARDVEDLCELLTRHRRTDQILIVSSDFGQSLPPEDSHQRLLRRSVGQSNAQLAALSKTIEIMIAGVVMLSKKTNK
jgi:adenosyl cobinamide kinase/adenosyl cobinamide phosphate guanylyltransferase